MKIISLFLISIGILYASNIEVKQNIKALYKDVKLSEVQKDYILDNQEDNIDVINNISKKELIKFKKKTYIHEKNIIEFTLNPDNSIGKIKFLKHSNNRKIDKLTKSIIKSSRKKFIKPNGPVLIRYIFVYEIGETSNTDDNNNKPSKSSKYYQNISQGTTRFEYSSKEYVRIFKTSEDGFVNFSATPQLCATASLLSSSGRKIYTGITSWLFNTEIPKGKYKLLIKVRKTCDVHLQYQ